MPLKFDLNKIKFATDPPTFAKAVDLYEEGKVNNFKEGPSSYSAIVEGGENYHVSVEARRFGLGYCDCYMGQKDYLCKHIVALSIYAVQGGKPLPLEEKNLNNELQCSQLLGELSKTEIIRVKKEISEAMLYIKSYRGPSRTWFAYQASLREGCNRLSAIVSSLPVSRQTSELLIRILLRLDKKLCTGGVDDSDGEVGGFITDTADILVEFAKIDPNCIKSFKLLCQQNTCFGWEENLVRIFDEPEFLNELM